MILVFIYYVHPTQQQSIDEALPMISTKKLKTLHEDVLGEYDSEGSEETDNDNDNDVQSSAQQNTLQIHIQIKHDSFTSTITIEYVTAHSLSYNAHQNSKNNKLNDNTNIMNQFASQSKTLNGKEILEYAIIKTCNTFIFNHTKSMNHFKNKEPIEEMLFYVLQQVYRIKISFMTNAAHLPRYKHYILRYCET